MKYRKLGRSGVQVSEVSFGTWLTFGGQLDEETAHACLREAWDCGINFFDTADVYAQGKAEEVLGRGLGQWSRKDYVLASKVFFPTGEGPNDRGLSRKHIMESCEASLRRLGVDYIDLYQCHRFDPESAVEETVRAMDDLIRQGKILYWGTSAWMAHQITNACRIAEKRNVDLPVTNQPCYNLIERSIEQEVIPTCDDEGIGQIVFSPLAQGLLTGKYDDGPIPGGSRASDGQTKHFLEPRMTAENLARSRRFSAMAREAGHTPAQLALAWVLRLRSISAVIIGATRAEHVRENAAASDVELTKELLQGIETAMA